MSFFWLRTKLQKNNNCFVTAIGCFQADALSVHLLFLQPSLRLPFFVPADDGLVADPVDGEPDVARLVDVFAVLLELAGNGGDLFRLGVGLVVFEGSGWSTPPCCSNIPTRLSRISRWMRAARPPAAFTASFPAPITAPRPFIGKTGLTLRCFRIIAPGTWHPWRYVKRCCFI